MNQINSLIGWMINESAIYLTESEIVGEKNGRVIAQARMQTGNERNRNGRRYLTTDLTREIAAPRQIELLSTGNMLGEAGHPMSKDLLRQQTIDPKYSCVRYLKFWMRGDDVMSLCKGTNNDLGETFDKDLRDGVKPAFSLRALGTVENTSEGAVVRNLKMITYDYVIYPSHPGAYTEKLITEAGLIPAEIPESNFIKQKDIYRKKLGFDLVGRMDCTQSFTESFDNMTVVSRIKQLQKESSAINYIKDESKNYKMLKEAFDLTNASGVEYDIDPRGNLTIHSEGTTIYMNIEDYITKEIQQYTKF